MIEEVSIKVVKHVVKITSYRNGGTDSMWYDYTSAHDFESEMAAREFIKKYEKEVKITPPLFQLPDNYETFEYIESMSLDKFIGLGGFSTTQ